MILVECSKKYWEFVRLLRNDPKVSSGFIESVFITEKDQSKYMHVNSKFYKVCLLDEIPCGYVGVIGDDIRICTHPNYQRKGVGSFMLREIKNHFPDAVGKVKLDNFKSRGLFVSAGFSQYKNDDSYAFYKCQK
jgi:GNAT superfamily N-acetyltransferase